MDQGTLWLTRFNEIMAFMAENHRRPSKCYMEERNKWNWYRMRHQQKLMGKGEMKVKPIELFERLNSIGVRETK